MDKATKTGVINYRKITFKYFDSIIHISCILSIG